jgi:rhomboid family GlyGly-CTERM serine protease
MGGDGPVKSVARLLTSLNGDGRRGWTLLLACAALVVPALVLQGPDGEALRGALRYDRAAVATGQVWRLVTGHLVHLDAGHALLNAAGLVLLWVLFAGLRTPAYWLGVALMSLLAIDAGFWWLEPQLAWYVGASGLLHGLMAAGTLCLIQDRDRIGIPTALVFAAKIAWEQRVGPLPLETHATVIVAAHLYGALGGLLAAALSWARHVAIMRAH